LADVVKPEWPWGDTEVVDGSMERALIIAGSRDMLASRIIIHRKSRNGGGMKRVKGRGKDDEM
jgi:hypothetical protein